MDIRIDIDNVNRGPFLKDDYWFEVSDEAKFEAYNGVGPEHFPRWMRKLLDIVFHWAKEAIFIHDVDYTYSDSKWRSDWRFFLNCLMACDFQIKRVLFSMIMFLSVLFFGKKAFNASRL